MKAFEYAAPKTLKEAVGLLAEKGEKARILAGGTDILVQIREGRKEPDWLVDIKHVPEVNALTFAPGKGLTIGAAVPCNRLYEHKDIPKHYPGLNDAVSLIGGIQIQNRASIGGNLCNSSPAADSIPALIACEGTCTIDGPKGKREVPVEKFCTGPGKNVLEKGELLVGLHFPAPKPHTGTAYLRFIPRNEMDIAVVGVGVSVTLEGDKCVAARVSVGAVAPTPLLVVEAGAALVGTTLQPADLDRTSQKAQEAAKPISDMRGDAEYRRHLVGVLVRRALQTAITRA
ncbi:MAG: FAD binding domain-containing protein, partial [Gemmataceae bacterium]